jgi:hypothetical protein
METWRKEARQNWEDNIKMNPKEEVGREDAD